MATKEEHPPTSAVSNSNRIDRQYTLDVPVSSKLIEFISFERFWKLLNIRESALPSKSSSSISRLLPINQTRQRHENKATDLIGVCL